MNEHLTFRVHFQSDAQDWLHLLSYERVKSLNILEDGMAPSLFCLLYVSAMQTHKGQSLKHEAFARSKGRSLPSQPLESLWTSVQKRMVWTSPLQSEIDLDWFCSRFASVVQVRATRKRFEVKDWKQRTGTSDKWQVHTSRRRRSWTGLLCCRLRHVLYVKGFDMEGRIAICYTRTLAMAPIRLYTWSILKWTHCMKSSPAVFPLHGFMLAKASQSILLFALASVGPFIAGTMKLFWRLLCFLMRVSINFQTNVTTSSFV